MPVEVILPKVDMDMSSGTIASWHISEGEQIEAGEALFDIETDKAVMEVESPATGTLRFVTGQKGDEVPIGQVVAWIFKDGEQVVAPAVTPGSGAVRSERSKAPEPVAANPSGAVAPEPQTAGIRATPLARRLAKEAMIDLSRIRGTGPRGRIVRADIDAAGQHPDAISVPLPVVGGAGAGNGNGAGARKVADDLGISYTKLPVGRMRSIIAERLTLSKSTVPHFYLNADIQIDDLLAFRAQINRAQKITGAQKVSVTDLLVKACALALKAVPEANVSWDGDCIIQFEDANISVAVSVEGGLMTPVVRAAQSKDIQAISVELGDLADRARNGKLTKKEYLGGSFSISNLGMFGVKSFAAIINPPESMILAVGRGVSQFIPDARGNPKLATIMAVTLSCDHRVVDGALGATWLETFRELVENPVTLLLADAFQKNSEGLS